MSAVILSSANPTNETDSSQLGGKVEPPSSVSQKRLLSQAHHHQNIVQSMVSLFKTAGASHPTQLAAVLMAESKPSARQKHSTGSAASGLLPSASASRKRAERTTRRHLQNRTAGLEGFLANRASIKKPPSKVNLTETAETGIKPASLPASNSSEDLLSTLAAQAAPNSEPSENATCVRCKEQLIFESHESLLICPKCKQPYPYLDTTSAAVAYGDEVEFLNIPYKRRNHFRDSFINAQGKETVQVPQKIILKIMEELYRAGYRQEDLHRISIMEIGRTMKKLKLRPFYKHRTQIWSRITGSPKPLMSSDHEDRLMLMFDMIQEPFKKYQLPGKRNFANYSTTLFRFHQLLGKNEYLPFFTLSKGARNRAEIDTLFRNICKDLGWPTDWDKLDVRPFLAP